MGAVVAASIFVCAMTDVVASRAISVSVATPLARIVRS
jgi:hypothetical protein